MSSASCRRALQRSKEQIKYIIFSVHVFVSIKVFSWEVLIEKGSGKQQLTTSVADRKMTSGVVAGYAYRYTQPSPLDIWWTSNILIWILVINLIIRVDGCKVAGSQSERAMWLLKYISYRNTVKVKHKDQSFRFQSVYKNQVMIPQKTHARSSSMSSIRCSIMSRSPVCQYIPQSLSHRTIWSYLIVIPSF